MILSICILDRGIRLLLVKSQTKLTLAKLQTKLTVNDLYFYIVTFVKNLGSVNTCGLGQFSQKLTIAVH